MLSREVSRVCTRPRHSLISKKKKNKMTLKTFVVDMIKAEDLHELDVRLHFGYWSYQKELCCW